MSMVYVRLNRPLEVRGIRMPAGRETFLPAAQAGALAGDGEAVLLDAHPLAEAVRAEVAAARRKVYGPEWRAGSRSRGVECRAYGPDGNLIHRNH